MIEKNEADLLLEQYKSNSKSALIYDEVTGKPLTEDKIKIYSDKILDLLIEQASENNDYGKLSSSLRNLIELKKAWYPATVINKNLNVNLFDDQLKKWINARKKVNLDSDEVIKKEIIAAVDKKDE